MNIAQAKQIPLEAALRHMGAEETKAKPDRSEIWYLSPLREEKTASFKINTEKNIWYDHGAGMGGDIIKLAQEHTRGTVSEALQWLKTVPATITSEKTKPRTTGQPGGTKEASTAGPVYELVKEKPLTNRTLITYAKSRGLQMELAEKHFREIHFKSKKSQKNLYGIGLQNDGGGWSVRGAIGDFKAVIAPHGITTIYSQEEARTLDVFEGGFDYSTKEHLFPANKNAVALILNSASFAQAGIDKILADPKFQAVKLIRTWFDNDKRGDEITHQYALALHGRFDVGDMRENYNEPDLSNAGQPYKDLNKWWTDCPTARQQQKQEFRPYNMKFFEERNEAIRQSLQPKNQ